MINLFKLYLLIISFQAFAHTVLFDGEDIRIEAHSFGHPNLWICFDPIKSPRTDTLEEPNGIRYKLDNKGWGQAYFTTRKIDFINIRNYKNHGYHTAEMLEGITICKNFIAKHDYKNIITYGLSMGGYGAVLHAEQLGVNRVLAFSPQFQFCDLKKELIVPGLQPIFDAPKNYDNCDFVVIFGYDNLRDKSIVQHPNGLKIISSNEDKKHIFPLDTDQHNTVSVLKDLNMLQTIVASVDKGDFNTIHESLLPACVPGDKTFINYGFNQIHPLVELIEGFAGFEAWGSWIDGASASFKVFPDPLWKNGWKDYHNLQLNLCSFIPHKDSKVHAKISINGHILNRSELNKNQ